MTNMCFDVCTWRVKVCVPGPLRESEFKEPHIWGFTVGFEGTVFCRVAEYPSSSMQAPRQQGIHAADRNTNECAALCFSGVPIDSHSSLGEVMKDTENGLFSVLWTTQTGPGLEAFLPWHCSCQTAPGALSEFSSHPPFWSSSRLYCLPLWTLRVHPHSCITRKPSCHLPTALPASVFLSHLESGTSHCYLLEVGNLL